MRKKSKNVLMSTLLVLIGIGMMMPTSVKAANVAPGGAFSATLYCGVNEGSIKVSGSNATITGGGNWCDRNGQVTATANAGSSGSASIIFTAVDVTNTSSMTEVAAGTRLGGNTVSIVAPSSGGNSGGGSTPPAQQPENDDRSTNNNLANLSISEGKLSPDFKADVTEYKVNLSAKTTKIKVDAKAADAKATVSGIGEKEVKPGDNAITITVKAENGATKNYVINAHVDEKPEVYLSYDGSKLGVVRNLSGVTPPAGFEESKVSIGGKEVKTWTSKIMKKTIVYLIDEKSGEKNFYIYDTKTRKVGSILKPTAILGNNVFIVDVAKKDRKIEGLIYKKIKVDSTELMGWEFADTEFKNYNLIYVMDENGKMQYYQYEKTKNTLQLFSNAAPITLDKYQELIKSSETKKIIIYGLAGLLVLLAGASAALLALKMKKK